jgi:hypothetical protein
VGLAATPVGWLIVGVATLGVVSAGVVALMIEDWNRVGRSLTLMFEGLTQTALGLLEVMRGVSNHQPGRVLEGVKRMALGVLATRSGLNAISDEAGVSVAHFLKGPKESVLARRQSDVATSSEGRPTDLAPRQPSTSGFLRGLGLDRPSIVDRAVGAPSPANPTSTTPLPTSAPKLTPFAGLQRAPWEGTWQDPTATRSVARVAMGGPSFVAASPPAAQAPPPAAASILGPPALPDPSSGALSFMGDEQQRAMLRLLASIDDKMKAGAREVVITFKNTPNGTRAESKGAPGLTLNLGYAMPEVGR